ncbi:hypothetical protein ACFWNC_14690 [Streptomyces sp. NPDC058369]|uniref:hypothetical protein n=1 Tax=Streptomyces sp. NPDC058369 TaxID=3346462 RepID=UPI0036490626
MANAVEWIAKQYPPLANHPMYRSRQYEYTVLKDLAEKHYGIDLSPEDFDQGIADRFGDGCEVEWAKE